MFEKRQAIQMAKDLVALGLSDLRSHDSVPIFCPEDVRRTAKDVVNSLCQCLESNGALDANCLQDAIEWLTELHGDIAVKLRKEHDTACEHVELWISLLQQGIIQHHHDSDGSLDGGLVDLTLMTSAHLALNELMQELDQASSEKISLRQSHMLQTGNTVVKNMSTVAQAVGGFHILPSILSQIVRDLSSEEELSAGSSRAVARMLCVSRSCKITAVLAHAALTTQVASASITEVYLCEIHLVWQTVLTRLQSVFSKAYILIDGNPEVLVDAVRCACLLDAVLREVIDDIVIRNLRLEGHTGHTSDDSQSIAVELLLVGLDEVSQVAGVSADTATICRRLIAKFAASCGDHIVTVLGQGLQPQQQAPESKQSCGAKLQHYPAADAAVKGSCFGGTQGDDSDTSEDLFQVHWPSASEVLAAEGSAHDIDHTGELCNGVHTSNESTSKLKIPELQDVSDSSRGSAMSARSSSLELNLSFASDVKTPHTVDFDGTSDWPERADVFWQLLQHWVTQGLQQKVSDLTQLPAAASEATASDDDAEDAVSADTPDTVEQQVETAVRQCREFLTTVDSDLSPCLPSRTGWDVLDTAFCAVKTHVREIIFWAAEDRLKQWTFKGYVKLVKIVLELIELAEELGVASDVLQDLEADLQVRNRPVTGRICTPKHASSTVDSCRFLSHLEAGPSLAAALLHGLRAKLVQIIYTRAGNLAQQFLMLCIDGATSSGDFMVVESEGSRATLPECIELLRMMHEQVELARGVNCWPLLQLVSIGCHASCATLHGRLHSMCQPPVLSPQGGASCTLAHPGRVPSSNALSMVSTPTKERKPISFQNTPTPGGPGASPGMATHPKMRSMGLMAYFVAASKPESQPKQCYGTAKSLEHEYPIQFMAALANSLQRIAEECRNTGVRIRGNTNAQIKGPPVANDGRAWQAPAALTQDQKDARAAACIQAEGWNELASDYLHTSQVCVNTMLQNQRRAELCEAANSMLGCRWVLQRMFTSQWLTDTNSSVQEGGLSTVLATCADYIGEVRGLAEESILLVYLRSLLRHLVCCIAAGMLLSELPFDCVWQKAATEELRRLHSFVATDMPEFASSAAQYLNMLAQYRACLCAPDEFTATSSFKQLIRFGDLAVEWIDAAWKQDVRSRTERRSDFYESAVRKCEEIEKESKLTEQQVTQVKKFAFKWKPSTFKNTATSPNIRAHPGQDAGQGFPQRGSPTDRMGQGEIERLNPYVVHLAKRGTMLYEVVQTF